MLNRNQQKNNVVMSATEIGNIYQNIGKLFLTIAAEYSKNIAIETESVFISYEELSYKVRQFATLFSQQKKDSQCAIVIGLHQPQDIVMAILGTLLVNCIYIPIEIDFPSENINYIINNAHAKFIVIDRKDSEKIKNLTSITNSNVIYLDEITATIPNIDFSTTYTHENQIASILYTSGSTGKPKGVFQTQQNILYHVSTLTKLFNITHKDKHSVLSSFIFDGSTTDLYCSLLNGATLVPVNVRNSGAAGLGEKIGQHQITIYHSTPTTYRELLTHLQTKSQLNSIRLIILGGEIVTRKDFILFQQNFSQQCIFVNGYGATETSGFVALNFMNNAQEISDLESDIIPIGKPVSGFEFLYKNNGEHDKESDLYIKSKYISMGYWQDPELTNKFFKLDPTDSTIRIFHTGDIVEKNDDGNIKLIGRADRLVKIRGNRVDLNEVEAAAYSIPQIYQAIVKPYDDFRTNSKELAIFVTLHTNEKNLDKKEIRQKLSKILLHYMVPTIVEIYEKFPLTDTGKIDIKSLEVKQQYYKNNEFFSQENQDVNKIILEVWKETLGTEQINNDDSFFDLGGTSLLMIQVHRKLETYLAIKIPLYILYEYSSLYALSQYLRNKTEKYHFEEIQVRMKKRQNIRI